MTRSNALYLSTAVQFNSEQLKPIVLWFRDQLVILLKNGPAQEIYFNPDLTFQYLKDPKTALWIHKFMECADIGIENFHLFRGAFNSSHYLNCIPRGSFSSSTSSPKEDWRKNLYSDG